MTDARFVLDPNLPHKSVKSLIIGEKYGVIFANMLGNLGISPALLPKNPDLPPETAFHADMSLCHMGFNKIIAAKSIFERLRGGIWDELEIIRADRPQTNNYPRDVNLNVCIIGDRLLHNLKYTDGAVAAASRALRLRTYHVNQGYTKCSVCIVDRRRIITADAGISETAAALGIYSLLITPGHITLDGYDSGFLGGCCAKLAPDIIAFTGRLDKHPDKKRILAFIGAAGIRPVYLTDEPIFDVGSMIPITEEV